MTTEVRKVSEYAAKMTIDVKHDVAMFYSGNLWIGALFDGVIRFNAIDSDFCEAVYRQWLDSTPGRSTLAESEFRNSVANQLMSEGWSVSKEQYTSQGRIDILAERGKEQRIIEVKLGGKSNDAAHALGQLMFYARFYPKASLWFCSHAPADATVKSILGFYGVNVLEVK